MHRNPSRFLRRLQHLSDQVGSVVCARRISQKLLVLESDDWGSIRTSTRESYERLNDSGWHMENSPYNLDALETEEDMELLLSVLNSFRDTKGNPPCLTANMVLAYPDFHKIRNSGFTRYFFLPVVDFIRSDPARQNLPFKWANGISQGLFLPQLHAREHVCWWRWLEALRGGSEEGMITFDLGMCGVPLASSQENQSFFTPLYVEQDELHRYGVNLQEIIRDGHNLFREAFGFSPLSTVPPNHHWTDQAESIWAGLGIRYIQGVSRQKMGSGAIGARVSTRFHYLGEKNVHDMMYLVRNVEFEPSSSKNVHWINKAMKQIRFAFLFHHPAIINTHRQNYIGSINKENRDNGLTQLSELLDTVLKQWPDVQFVSSPELGRRLYSRNSAHIG